MATPSFYDKEIVSRRDSLFGNISSGEAFNDYFFSILGRYLRNGQKILDLGTGNGYILSEISTRFPNYSLRLFGVDNSQAMIKRANDVLEGKASILIGENSSIPFSDSSFDLVTAKNVTSIYASEIRRILKSKKHFIFREYGLGKGLIEVAGLFLTSRLVRPRPIGYYTSQLLDQGFSIDLAEQHLIQRNYNLEELINIVKSFPFVEDFSKEDEEKIREKFRNPIEKITSDPFIIVARRER